MNKLNSALEKLLLFNFFVFVLFFYHSKLLVKIILGVGMAIFILINILELLAARKKKISLSDRFKYLSQNRLLKPVSIFLFSAVISTIFSIEPIHSQRVLFERFVPYFLFFMLGCYLAKFRKGIIILTILFITNGVILGIAGIREYFYSPVAGRLYYLFHSPFNFTPFLLFFLPLSFAIAFFAKNKFLRLLAAASLITWALCFYWNNSRAVWLAVPIALLVVTFLKSKRLAVIFLIIFILIFSLLSVSFKERVSTVLDTLTWGGRLELYKSAVKIYKDFPVFGAGLGEYEKLLYKYAEYSPTQVNSKKGIHLHAHNTYLEIAANMGTVGVLSFVGIFVVFFFILLRNKPLWKKRPAEEQAILLGLSASILASLIVAFATTIIIVGVQDPAIFWFFFGVASALL